MNASTHERNARRSSIYTDGACKGNPGRGGWGAWLRSGEHEKELLGGEPLTTNNRMELTAVIEALASLKRRCDVTLYTDSEYVRKGITEWIHGWKQRGWKTADKKPVKNIDLWQRLDALVAAAPGRVALGQGPCRRPGQRARRRAGQPRRAPCGHADCRVRADAVRRRYSASCRAFDER